MILFGKLRLSAAVVRSQTSSTAPTKDITDDGDTVQDATDPKDTTDDTLDDDEATAADQLSIWDDGDVILEQKVRRHHVASTLPAVDPSDDLSLRSWIPLIDFNRTHLSTG